MVVQILHACSSPNHMVCVQVTTTKTLALTNDAQADNRSTCDTTDPSASLYVIPTPGEDDMDPSPFYLLFKFTGVRSWLLCGAMVENPLSVMCRLQLGHVWGE